jgi:hypothetical protein
VEGGCRCGAVRYRLAVDAMPPAYCCHCLDCQSSSGSAFSEQAVVREGAIEVSGTPVEFSLRTYSGATSRHFVCGACHTRIYNVNSSRPGIVIVRAGTLDASDRIEPRAHIWVKRKQPWIVLPEGLPVFEEGAPLEAWREILA